MKKVVLPLLILGMAALWLLVEGHLFPGFAAAPPTPVDASLYGPIGINLYSNVDYGNAHVWADAARNFRRWGQVGAAHEENPHLTFTPDGYPLQDADSLSYFNNYPNGVYKLTWVGSGNVLVGGIGVEGRIVREGDAAAADVEVKHNGKDGLTGGMLYLSIRSNVAASPVHDIHLWSPGYGPGDLFTTDFIRRVRPFNCIRFMDWAGANNSSQVHWSDRVHPANMIQTNGAVSWESMIALANQTGRDMWINVPLQADDDYVRHLALLIKSQLQSNLKVRIEYSNEVWNPIFKQFGQNMDRSKQNPDLTAKDDFGRAAQQYAVRAKQIGDIFRGVWGDQAERLIPVIGGQASNNYWHDMGLQYLHDHVGPPANYFKEIAIAPYVGDQAGAGPAGGWTLDTLFPFLEHFTATTMAQWTRDAKASADKWGMQLAAYEGGEDLLTAKSLPEALVPVAQKDPRMYVLYHAMSKTWHANGGGLFCEFSHIGGGWGLLDSSTQVGSPKWDAVMDMILPKGAANLDSKVGYADFLILQAHWGSTTAWWEEGDFNGDRIVDHKDLDLLLPNLTGLTPEQHAAVDAFRAAHPK